MRPSCEVAVDRQAILDAIEMDGHPLNPMHPEDVRIGPAEGGIRIETVSVTADIAAVGVWSKAVIVDGTRLHRILLDGVNSTVLLTYVDGVLSIDRTMIDACAEPEPGTVDPHQLELGIVGRGVPGARRKRQFGLTGLPLFRQAP